jgi:predicted transcriptional regulator of viral defense system
MIYFDNCVVRNLREITYMPAVLGPLETKLLTYAQSRTTPSLATGDMVKALGWTVEQEREVLSRLSRKDILVRVRPGLYLVPRRLPPGGRWSPGEFLALTTLMQDRGGRYQISGPNAFYRYGWTEQVPNRLYVYNNRISGNRQIGAVALTLIKVDDERLGGTEVLRTPDGIDVLYASRPRSLVDAVYDWSRFGTLPKGYDWIRKEVEKDDTLAADIVQATIQFGNQATVRRIGALLERLDARESLLRRLERQLNPSSSYIPWIPILAKRGKTSNRWGVVVNDE